MEDTNTHIGPLQIILGIIILGLLAMGGFALYNNKQISSSLDCTFPQSSTDLKIAGQKLSEEVSGKVGYGESGFLTVESENGFVMLTPVAETDIETNIKDRITEALGCEGSTKLSYWVFEVSDPAQLPPEMISQLGEERPHQILLILGSFYVFSVDTITSNPDAANQAVTRIVIDHGGTVDRGSPSPFTPPQSPDVVVPFPALPDPAPLELPDLVGGGGSFDNSGGSSNNGGGGTNTGRPVGTGGGTDITGGLPSQGSAGQCTLQVVCEDRVTGNHYQPGVSGCQGADFYAQTPTPPSNTRQVALCVYGNGTLSPTSNSCPDLYWFYFRNCMSELDSLRIGSTANFDSSNLPTSPGTPGTLYVVPATMPGVASRTIRCSYGSDNAAHTEAVQCGMPMSGEYCLPGYNPVGCVAAPADFSVGGGVFNPQSIQPSASLTVNNSNVAIVNVGDPLVYRWNTSVASAPTAGHTVTSRYTADSNDSCSSDVSISVGTNNPQGQISKTAQACQSGHTYTITLEVAGATGQKSQASVTVQVK